MPLPVTAMAPLVRALIGRGANSGGMMGPPERNSARNLMGAPFRAFGRADNAFRNFTGGIGEGLSSGAQNLMRALGGMLGRGPSMSQHGPMQGGYQYPGASQGPPQQQTISMPGSQVAGGTAPWMQGMLPYTQPGATRGYAGGSGGAVGAMLSLPFASSGDAIGFKERSRNQGT